VLFSKRHDVAQIELAFLLSSQSRNVGDVPPIICPAELRREQQKSYEQTSLVESFGLGLRIDIMNAAVCRRHQKHATADGREHRRHGQREPDRVCPTASGADDALSTRAGRLTERLDAVRLDSAEEHAPRGTSLIPRARERRGDFVMSAMVGGYPRVRAWLCFVFATAVLVGAAAQARERTASKRDSCADLASLAFEGNTTITAATVVSSGTLVTPAGQTLTNLPSFCRAQGVSRPSSDSHIYFEVWLPTDTWNSKFLSSGEGGYVGALNYTRLGLDGGLDELLRRGYATASTDTGHVASDAWWAVGHPERIVDYLYRAKHLVTVAAKALVKAYYGRPATHSYFNSCSNGGR
jgi:Tannase and feruloyl esterase